MEENLNIINQWGKPQKREGRQILIFQWGEAKEGEHNFWLKFSGGKYWRKVEKTFFVCKCKYE